jgi:hypothetical protein
MAFVQASGGKYPPVTFLVAARDLLLQRISLLRVQHVNKCFQYSAKNRSQNSNDNQSRKLVCAK